MKTKMRDFSLWLWREWVRPMLLIAVIVFPLRSMFADWNYIPSGSMIPTLLPGDLVFINKAAYDLKVPFTTMHIAEWGDPERGDIAIFYSPEDGTRLVKRVIGLPGDTIECRNERLLINGMPVEYTQTDQKDMIEDAAAAGTPTLLFNEALPGQTHAITVLPERSALRSFGPITVGAGQYFMLGDNRDNSHDSRFYGCVPRKQIIGRAVGVIGSVNLEKHLAPRLHRFGRGVE